MSGFGFGPTNHGDIPTARAAADGTFTLLVAPDHGYGLNISDLQWASDGWSGLILPDEKTAPAEISMDVYRATPLEVRSDTVVRGTPRKPAPGFLCAASTRSPGATRAEKNRVRRRA